jgi:hypothetical protein
MKRLSMASRRGKLASSATLGVATILAAVSIALAANPVKGAKYSGRVNATANFTVSFKVSRSGKKVTAMKVKPSLPLSCSSGGPPPPQTSKPATIKDGKFTARVTETASSGTVIATAKITGKFLAKGKEKGNINVTLPNAKSCNGSFSYSTKVKR